MRETMREPVRDRERDNERLLQTDQHRETEKKRET